MVAFAALAKCLPKPAKLINGFPNVRGQTPLELELIDVPLRVEEVDALCFHIMDNAAAESAHHATEPICTVRISFLIEAKCFAYGVAKDPPDHRLYK